MLIYNSIWASYIKYSDGAKQANCDTILQLSFLKMWVKCMTILYCQLAYSGMGERVGREARVLT